MPGDEEGMLPWEWAAEQLLAARNYWICTTGADGSPHAAPVWGLWHDDALVFSTSPGSAKGRNLRRDPRLVVHLESGDDVVIVEGAAEEIPLDEAIAKAFHLVTPGHRLARKGCRCQVSDRASRTRSSTRS